MGGMDGNNASMNTIFGLYKVHQIRNEMCDDKFDICIISIICGAIFICGAWREGGMGVVLNRLFCFASRKMWSISVGFVAETC